MIYICQRHSFLNSLVYPTVISMLYWFFCSSDTRHNSKHTLQNLTKSTLALLPSHSKYSNHLRLSIGQALDIFIHGVDQEVLLRFHLLHLLDVILAIENLTPNISITTTNPKMVM